MDKQQPEGMFFPAVDIKIIGKNIFCFQICPVYIAEHAQERSGREAGGTGNQDHFMDGAWQNIKITMPLCKGCQSSFRKQKGGAVELCLVCKDIDGGKNLFSAEGAGQGGKRKERRSILAAEIFQGSPIQDFRVHVPEFQVFISDLDGRGTERAGVYGKRKNSRQIQKRNVGNGLKQRFVGGTADQTNREVFFQGIKITELIQIKPIRTAAGFIGGEDFIQDHMENGTMKVDQNTVSSDEDFEKLILAYDYSTRTKSRYKAVESDAKPIKNGPYTYPEFQFVRRNTRE